MPLCATIFSDFNLPNATTWFYFSWLLAIALFFKFSRLLSVRNLDVLTLFLLVPGFLLLMEARFEGPSAQRAGTLRAAQLVGDTTAAMALAPGASLPGLTVLATIGQPTPPPSTRLAWYAYLWLFGGSIYWFIRCLADLPLVRRPLLPPNLNLAGLAWLGAALFICLVAVGLRRPVEPTAPVGKPSAAADETQRRAGEFVTNEGNAVSHQGRISELLVKSISAIVCHLAIVVALAFIGWRHFKDAHAGFAAATAYLLLPYTAYHVEQFHHVLPTALLMWAVASYRKPLLAGVLLGLASGAGYFVALLFLPWISFYRSGGQGRFTLGFLLAAGLFLGAIAGILWMDDEFPRVLHDALALSDWQPWKQPNPQTTQGFWTGLTYAPFYRLPVFILYSAFVLTTIFWPAPKNLAHLLALSAAILIGIQFWFADQGGVYVLWYLPLLLLVVFRPNLMDREALPINPDTDWLYRARRSMYRVTMRVLRLPEPMSRVP